jgi:hypothetical protein
MTVSLRRLSVVQLPFTSTINKPTPRLKRTYSPVGRLGRVAQRAAALRLQIDELNKQLEPLREELLQAMVTRKLTTMQSGDVTITVRSRNKWQYSIETEREQLKLTQTQRWEQEKGVARNTPTPYVAITMEKK